MRRLPIIAAVLFASGLPLFAPVSPVRAETTFVVNGRTDQPDLTPGDGRCDVIPDVLLAGDQCTLRAAIQEANATTGTDIIHFLIPGTGVRTIAPDSELPDITDPLTIDGYTQPGAAPNTATDGGTNAVLLIELDGTNARPGTGLTITASNSVVKGLVINRFSKGVRLADVASATGNRLEGCFVGTDPTGTLDRSNVDHGVLVLGADAIVGGTTPATRNLISGNNDHGVLLGVNATGIRVEGNLIGTDRSGAAPLANTDNGIEVVGSDNFVGGNVAAAANTIAFNGDHGVLLPASAGTGNRILRNSIFQNGDLGIDLEGGTEVGVGATANDPGDPDAGPNTLQNKPQVNAAITAGGATTVQGTLNSTPGQTFVLRFFANPSGENEGRSFVGQRNVTTNAGGNAPFTFVRTPAVAVGEAITATATGPGGNTSEFSPPRTVTAG